MNLSKTAENHRLPENHPSLGFIYTTHRLNFFGMYEYDHEKSNYHAAKFLTLKVLISLVFILPYLRILHAHAKRVIHIAAALPVVFFSFYEAVLRIITVAGFLSVDRKSVV